MLSAHSRLAALKCPKTASARSSNRWASSSPTRRTSVSRRGGVTSSAPPTWSRKSRGSPATIRSSPRLCPAPRRRQADRHAFAADRAPGPPHRRCARPRRSRDLELHLRKEAEAFGGGPWRLANPISEEMKVMRPSLLPGLIAAARRNLDRGAPSVRLFEIGRRYLEDSERPTATLLLAGDKQPRSWQSGKAKTLRRLRREGRGDRASGSGRSAGREPAALSGCRLRPGIRADRQRCVLGPKTIVAAFGELHPRLEKLLDAPERAVAAEVYLDAIPAPRSSGHARANYTPPALQPVTRDFAFIVPADVPADNLVRAIRGADKQAIVAARLFDRFEDAGRPQPRCRRSLCSRAKRASPRQSLPRSRRGSLLPPRS